MHVRCYFIKIKLVVIVMAVPFLRGRTVLHLHTIQSKRKQRY